MLKKEQKYFPKKIESKNDDALQIEIGRMGRNKRGTIKTFANLTQIYRYLIIIIANNL